MTHHDDPTFIVTSRKMSKPLIKEDVDLRSIERIERLQKTFEADGGIEILFFENSIWLSAIPDSPLFFENTKDYIPQKRGSEVKDAEMSHEISDEIIAKLVAARKKELPGF